MALSPFPLALALPLPLLRRRTHLPAHAGQTNSPMYHRAFFRVFPSYLRHPRRSATVATGRDGNATGPRTSWNASATTARTPLADTSTGVAPRVTSDTAGIGRAIAWGCDRATQHRPRLSARLGTCCVLAYAGRVDRKRGGSLIG